MRLTIGSRTKRKKTFETNKEPEFAKSPKGFIIELIKIVLIALAIIIPVRYFLFQPFYVRGASMEPNFFDNEYLIIDEVTYRFSDPKRGDVVVVQVPQKKNEYLIKRIIALPNETIEIMDNMITIHNSDNVDGFVLNETYLGEGIFTQGNKTATLNDKQYYVMGDNRPVSLDSRSFGPLVESDIVGRTWLRVWPFSQFKHFETPEYNLSSL